MSHLSIANSPGLVRPQRDFVCYKCVPPAGSTPEGFFCKCESASHHWFNPSVSSLRNLDMIDCDAIYERTQSNQMISE